jgi:hypothetical protein
MYVYTQAMLALVVSNNHDMYERNIINGSTQQHALRIAIILLPK